MTDIDHLALMSLKVAMLEELVKNLFATGFEASPNPVDAAHAFVEQYRRFLAAILTGKDIEANVLIEEVWNEFLDGLVAEVQRRASLSKL